MTYRSGPPGLPREAGTEGSRDNRETLMVGDKPSFFIFRAHFVRISIIYLVFSLSFFSYKVPFSPPVESGTILGKAPLPERGPCLILTRNVNKGKILDGFPEVVWFILNTALSIRWVDKLHCAGCCPPPRETRIRVEWRDTNLFFECQKKAELLLHLVRKR